MPCRALILASSLLVLAGCNAHRPSSRGTAATPVYSAVPVAQPAPVYAPPAAISPSGGPSLPAIAPPLDTPPPASSLPGAP